MIESLPYVCATVAPRLFVSPRTVQSHLTHIFAKLDLTPRTELAAEARRRGFLSPADTPCRGRPVAGSAPGGPRTTDPATKSSSKSRRIWSGRRASR